MYSFNINQFKRIIEEKNSLEVITYATTQLSQAEEILLNTKACKDTESLEEYIDFLKGFLDQH